MRQPTTVYVDAAAGLRRLESLHASFTYYGNKADDGRANFSKDSADAGWVSANEWDRAQQVFRDDDDVHLGICQRSLSFGKEEGWESRFGAK